MISLYRMSLLVLGKLASVHFNVSLNKFGQKGQIYTKTLALLVWELQIFIVKYLWWLFIHYIQ